MISQFSIPVKDLLPEVKNSKTVERADNLEDVLPQLVQEIEARPWLQQFLEDVRKGDKQAIFKLAVGSIVVTAAVGAGYELGVAHGRDLKSLIRLLGKQRRPRERKKDKNAA